MKFTPKENGTRVGIGPADHGEVYGYEYTVAEVTEQDEGDQRKRGTKVSVEDGWDEDVWETVQEKVLVAWKAMEKSGDDQNTIRDIQNMLMHEEAEDMELKLHEAKGAEQRGRKGGRGGDGTEGKKRREDTREGSAGGRERHGDENDTGADEPDDEGAEARERRGREQGGKRDQVDGRSTAKKGAAAKKRMSKAEGRMKGSSKERAAGRNRSKGNTTGTRKGRVTREPRENEGHGHGKAREGRKKWQQQKACGER